MTVNLEDGVIVRVKAPLPAVARAYVPDPFNVIPIKADLVLAGSGGGVQVKPQNTPSSSWLFAHNLGRLPLAEVWLSDGLGGYEQVDPDIHADNVNINIVFPEPHSGVLILR